MRSLQIELFPMNFDVNTQKYIILLAILKYVIILEFIDQMIRATRFICFHPSMTFMKLHHRTHNAQCQQKYLF